MTGFKNGVYEGPGEIKSVVVNYDRTVSGTYPALRFPAAGRVVAAYIFANVAASGTNLIQVGVINGGVTGAGTVITAPQSSGTTLLGSAYALSIAADGREAYALGELCMVNITTLDSPTDVSVQIDYYIKPTE